MNGIGWVIISSFVGQPRGIIFSAHDACHVSSGFGTWNFNWPAALSKTIVERSAGPLGSPWVMFLFYMWCVDVMWCMICSVFVGWCPRMPSEICLFREQTLYNHWSFGIKHPKLEGQPYPPVLRGVVDKPYIPYPFLNQPGFHWEQEVFPSQFAIVHSSNRLHGISGLVDYEEGDELIRLPCPALTWTSTCTEKDVETKKVRCEFKGVWWCVCVFLQFVLWRDMDVY